MDGGLKSCNLDLVSQENQFVQLQLTSTCNEIVFNL